MPTILWASAFLEMNCHHRILVVHSRSGVSVLIDDISIHPTIESRAMVPARKPDPGVSIIIVGAPPLYK